MAQPAFKIRLGPQGQVLHQLLEKSHPPENGQLTAVTAQDQSRGPCGVRRLCGNRHSRRRSDTEPGVFGIHLLDPQVNRSEPDPISLTQFGIRYRPTVDDSPVLARQITNGDSALPQMNDGVAMGNRRRSEQDTAGRQPAHAVRSVLQNKGARVAVNHAGEREHSLWKT